jgi:acetolactate synthase-1/2/3 large subunit
MRVKSSQRHIVNSGCAAMGYGLPAAVGACFANARRRVICLEGDGSIQLNIQELATVAYHRLPLKIIVFNNDGYLSIRTTQRAFFEGRLVGEGPNSGVGLPDIARIAEAYGIHSVVIRNHLEMTDLIRAVLEYPGPVLCDVRMTPNQEFVPRVTSRRLANGRMASSPLEDMYPFLDRSEFLSNMIIPPWEPKE